MCITWYGHPLSKFGRRGGGGRVWAPIFRKNNLRCWILCASMVISRVIRPLVDEMFENKTGKMKENKL
jgi:hypothetical protein